MKRLLALGGAVAALGVSSVARAQAAPEALFVASEDAPIATAPREEPPPTCDPPPNEPPPAPEAAPAIAPAPVSGPALADQGYAAATPQDAARDFDAALAAGGLSPAQARAVRLALADARRRAGDGAGALPALEPLAAEPSYEVQARRAQALDDAGRRAEAAQAYAVAAQSAPSEADRVALLRGQVFALAAAGRANESLATARGLAETPGIARDDLLNLAYLAIKLRDDALAQRFFARADAAAPLADAAALDAAYSARRAGNERQAVAYLKRALDSAVRRGQADAQPREGVRRELADLTRRGGAYASLFYDDTDSRAQRVPGAGAGNLQVGFEAYLRPFGYNGGRTVEVFARAFQTLDSRRGDPTGGQTLQGWLGVRAKPFAQENLVLEASRLVAVGDRARNDWMVRGAWSATSGMDPALDPDARMARQLYVDVARLLGADETFAVADARLGPRYRTARGRLIVTPFLGATLAYDSGLARETALGAGPGIWARFWTRADRYRAPQSYADVVVQYRARIAGDRRAEGLFASFSISY